MPIEGERSVWESRQADIRVHILDHDPGEFIKWPSINGTMFVGDCDHVEDELMILQMNGWRRWEKVMKVEGFGAPESELMEGTSGNIIHQAHHLHVWENLSGKKVEDLDCIVEIGGGYGTLARVVSELGFIGQYIIYDLPEMTALQEYYLGDIPGDFRLISDINELIDLQVGADLLVGIYSLSEMDIESRWNILENIPAESYCFVYQKIFEGMDNVGFFADVVLNRQDFDWQNQKVVRFPNSKYLVGVKDDRQS